MPPGIVLAATAAFAQAPLPPVPAAMGIPKPGPVVKGKPYQPQPLLPGGIVMPLFPAGSPFLNAKRVSEAEVYTMDPVVPGRVRAHRQHPQSLDRSASGGRGQQYRRRDHPGRRAAATTRWWSGIEGIDPVPYFFNYGINTIILRNRLRKDGYDAKIDAVYDLQQAIRLVRAHAAEWNIDPKKIGVMGFSAGAELTMAAAIQYMSSMPRIMRRAIRWRGSPRVPISWARSIPARRSSPRAARRRSRRMRRRPSSSGAGWGDKVHAVWADEYFAAMLNAGIPNVEMHIYAIGTHGRGLSYREGTGVGTWPTALSIGSAIWAF